MKHKFSLIFTSLFTIISTLLTMTSSVKASPSGAWAPTGSMNTPRVLHTATLLADGRVLVVGGLNFGRNPTATAELYDPATGTWTATGSMMSARSRHTATLLSDGRVLVVGGRDQIGISIATVELYDPQTGTWSFTGSMTTARSYHAATLLSSGSVLVTGGLNDGNSPILEKSAEIYDPSTSKWHIVDHMANARYGHTSTLLPDGRVLITGGAGHGGDCISTITAELYDPISSTWKPALPMGIARGFHTAALLIDGKMLVTGGNTIGQAGLIHTVPPNCVAIAQTAELYDPNSGTWTPTDSMAQSRSGQTATVLPDGRVLVAGGRHFDGNIYGAVATIEVYRPSTGTWNATDTMSTARAFHTATLLNDGRVLVCGGHSGASFFTNQLSTAEVYTP